MEKELKERGQRDLESGVYFFEITGVDDFAPSYEERVNMHKNNLLNQFLELNFGIDGEDLEFKDFKNLIKSDYIGELKSFERMRYVGMTKLDYLKMKYGE